MKYVWILICFTCCLLMCSCKSSDDGVYVYSDSDKISRAEEDAIVAHVRKFLLRNRRLKLSSADRDIIKNTRPNFNIRYTGKKEGVLILRWKLDRIRILLLQRTGNLLTDTRADWMIRVISDKTQGQLPANFYGAKGEDVSLPPQ